MIFSEKSEKSQRVLKKGSFLSCFHATEKHRSYSVPATTHKHLK